MAFGQGAKAALPIYGLYMKKLYNDRTLPYSQDEKFMFPSDFRPCDGGAYRGSRGGGGGGGAPAPTEQVEEVIATALE